MKSLQPDTRLTRDDAAAALREHGHHYSSSTLTSRNTRRTGPPVESFAGRPMYTWGSTLAWAEAEAQRRNGKRRAA